LTDVQDVAGNAGNASLQNVVQPTRLPLQVFGPG
jgi:hypothetical protein